MQQKNTTLSDQFQNAIEKYHTVGPVTKSNSKILERADIGTENFEFTN